MVVAKNRFFTITPQNAGQPTALRVVFSALPPSFGDFLGAQMWVGEPLDVCELSGIGLGETCPEGAATFIAAPLVCEPVFMDWGSQGPIQVFGEWVVPGAAYGIQTISQGCHDLGVTSFSPPLTAVTSRWGDVVGDCATLPCGPPDDSVDIVTDIVSMISKFANRTDAPSKARVDLEPGQLDLKINISDVAMGLDGFRGLPYSFPPPASGPCP